MIRKETYREMAETILSIAGGAQNIKSLGHCSLRLRLSLKDPDLARVEELERLNKVKKVFWAENQLQLALGFGLVTRVYDALFERIRQGPALLIHCSVDTVQLNGEGFTAKVENRQRVRKGGKRGGDGSYSSGRESARYSSRVRRIKERQSARERPT